MIRNERTTEAERKQAAVDDPDNYYYQDIDEYSYIFYQWNENTQTYTGGYYAKEER